MQSFASCLASSPGAAGAGGVNSRPRHKHHGQEGQGHEGQGQAEVKPWISGSLFPKVWKDHGPGDSSRDLFGMVFCDPFKGLSDRQRSGIKRSLWITWGLCIYRKPLWQAIRELCTKKNKPFNHHLVDKKSHSEIQKRAFWKTKTEETNLKHELWEPVVWVNRDPRKISI